MPTASVVRRKRRPPPWTSFNGPQTQKFGHPHHRRRSGKPHPRRIGNDALLVHIRAVHAHSRGEYGWPRVWKQLLAQGASEQEGAKADEATAHQGPSKRKFKAPPRTAATRCRWRRTCWSATSRRRHPTWCGRATSRTSPPTRAGCTWR
ncbi:MAG: transposase [Rhodoferax sp.]|nr:transposase [Rhodoferax sp.]